ncbi:MAG: DUF5665 domain-containing protein [Desulfosporosinus sp.]
MSSSSKETESTVLLSASRGEEADSVKVQDLVGLKQHVVSLTETLEKLRLADYIAYLNRPGRLLWLNFIVGLARGLGTALGAGLLAGFAYFLLKRIVILNLPVIGGFIAELSKYVEQP